MSRSIRSLLLAVALTTVGSAAGAPGASAAPAQAKPGEWTLAEKEHWALMEKELAQVVSLLNTSCESKITASFDKETFRGNLMEAGYTGLAASRFWTSVGDSVKTIRELCLKGGEGKKAVQTKIKALTIQHAGASRAHALNGTTVTAVVDKAANPRQWQTDYQTWLKSKL